MTSDAEYARAIAALSENDYVTITLPREALRLLVEGFDFAGDGQQDPFFSEQRAFVERYVGDFR